MSKTTDKPKSKYGVVIKFIVIMLCSGGLGALLSIAMRTLVDNTGVIGDVINAFLMDVILPAQWTVFLLLTAISIMLYIWGARYVKKVEINPEDEVSAAKADMAINLGITLATVNMILCYWLFGIQVTLPDRGMALLGGVAVIILVIAYYSAYMAKSVLLVKRINPEKKGDPLEFRFQKDWVGSCDEGEKMVIYQAAFFSYKLVSHVILVLWLITVLCSMFFDLGAYTVTVITVIWLANTIGYQWKCTQLNKKKLN